MPATLPTERIDDCQACWQPIVDFQREGNADARGECSNGHSRRLVLYPDGWIDVGQYPMMRPEE